MIFSTVLANDVKITDNGSKFLEAGIHENVKLVSAKTANSPQGNRFIEFMFEKDGKTFPHTEWEPKPRDGMSEEENQTKATNQVTRIMRILRCFYPQEVLNFSGDSYKEFAEWVVNMLNNANKETLLRVKIVYNDRGYTTLPSYVKFAFIEPMDIPVGFYEEGKKDSKIRDIVGIDRFTRPVVADKEEHEPDPFKSDTQTNDDLPF